MSRSVPCPTCGTLAVYGPCNPWRPFCSRRCRSIDLGAWASERFSVPAEKPPDGPNDPSRAGDAGDAFGHPSDDAAAPRH